MNLWFSSVLLVAGLFLRASAGDMEVECEPLMKPLSMSNSSMFQGRWSFLTGYVSTEEYNAFLKVAESSWMEITPLTGIDNVFQMLQENKMNGSCFISVANVTIEGDRSTVKMGDISTVFELLPGCETCLVFRGNSTAKNLSKAFKMMNLNVTVSDEEITTEALYLMSREATVSDADLEQFKKQARCIGFDRQPDFKYDSSNAFCEKDEGTVIELEN